MASAYAHPSDCICLHIHNEQADGTIAKQHDFHKSNPDQYLFHAPTCDS